MQNLDDIALLRKYAEHGSEQAFAALVARHINKVYSVAIRHTGNRQQAEEITQIVFIILARKSRKIGDRALLEGWLYQTARLTALASVRSEIRRAHREQEAYLQSASNENEPDIWPQIAPLLDAAIASLNKTDRDAVVLRFIYDKTMKEVGHVLGLSEGAARLRLHRAMEKLRHFFDKRGVVSTSEIIAGAISAHAGQTAPPWLAKTATALALSKISTIPSTITLIKGALKVMAWTKMKTVATAGVAVLLAAGATPVVVNVMRNHTRIAQGPRTTPVTASIKGQFFALGQLVDAGNVTPEAAWESRYWARAQGDYDAVIDGTDPIAVDTAKNWMGDKASFRARSREEFASFQGFQIVARKDLTEDRVELKYQFGFESDSTQPQAKIVTMVKFNGMWRCAQTRIYDVSWDPDSQSEPES